MDRLMERLAAGSGAVRGTGPGEVLVRFADVQKSYDGETLVVKNLNLDIYRGEFLTVLGPSGSGKTTCLMMLAGFETATHGEIFLEGISINQVPSYRRNIGMVFQNYALFPHMTVGENLAFPLSIRRMPKAQIEERVTWALEMVRLPGIQHRRPMQLSGGQQQRVAVARALVFEPKLVLMDEPLGALDKQLREQMQYEIKQLHETLGLTVVYVTHDQSEAMTMSDRIAVFSNGDIAQLATPAELYERPANAFVARFIGENNRLYGRVAAVDGEECIVTLNGGARVVAVAAEAARVGAPTMLSIRPERIVINPSEGTCHNLFSATVGDVVYLGDHRRIHLEGEGLKGFVVKVANTNFGARVVAGDTVSVGWRSEDCRALDAVGDDSAGIEAAE
jgi:putative spermidine/putrescine transport system ATP-binding protein